MCFSYTADPYSTNAALLGKKSTENLTFQLITSFSTCLLSPSPIIFQIIISISLKEPFMLFIFRSGNYATYFLLPLRYLKKYFSYPLKKYYKSIHEQSTEEILNFQRVCKHPLSDTENKLLRFIIINSSFLKSQEIQGSKTSYILSCLSQKTNLSLGNHT